MNDLVFRVSCDGKDDRDFPFRDGLSIGRSSDNTIVIDDPAVSPLHAVVSAWPDQATLECFGDAILLFPDGTPTRCLPLTPGVTFIIGSALIQCLPAGTPASLHSPCSQSDPPPLPPDRCPRCTFDLKPLPAVARFCPRCGVDLAPPSPDPPVPSARVIDWCQEIAALPESHARLHSLILIGYAAAMSRLGQRYETGLGTPKNEDEAIRCYIKAARLGNSQARSRLCSRGITIDT